MKYLNWAQRIAVIREWLLVLAVVFSVKAAFLALMAAVFYWFVETDGTISQALAALMVAVFIYGVVSIGSDVYDQTLELFGKEAGRYLTPREAKRFHMVAMFVFFAIAVAVLISLEIAL